MLIEGNWLDKATGYAVTHTKISAARGAADLWNTRDIQPT
jgi:hypothetical protein